MYIFVAPRRIVLKEKEVQDFRAVAERLVDESGIEAEFPCDGTFSIVESTHLDIRTFLGFDARRNGVFVVCYWRKY